MGRTVRIIHSRRTHATERPSKNRLESTIFLKAVSICQAAGTSPPISIKLLGCSSEGMPVWVHSSFGFRNSDEDYYTYMFAVALGVHMNTNSCECCREMLSVIMRQRTQHDDVVLPGFNTI
jgi:hypothetical protein